MTSIIMAIIHNFDVIGLLLILGSLVSVRKIILELPKGSILTKWKVLSVVIVLFIGGYLHVIYQHRFGDTFATEIVVSSLLLFGAIFVLMISTLSLQTTRDIRRMDVLELENTTDPLMGIRNRRYLDNKIIEEFKRFEHYETPFSVLMLDIDHFKAVNDNYGHDVGDEVLVTLGKSIREYIRENDCASRYGGEEIIVVCPSTKKADAFNLAQRIREHIESLTICDLNVTVSIGVAESSSRFKEANEIIKDADRALYIAKHNGRNCVVSYVDTPLV